jgi:hypothetical protein
MRTPYGQECGFYYQDFARGRALQECRLLGSKSGWEPALCKTCPVPGIQLANACPSMVLQGRIDPGFLNLNRRVKVSTYCRRTLRSGFDPHVGCGECHLAINEIQTAK